MTINLKMPDIRELKPRITVFGVGGAGGNAVNNMINAGLEGVDFVVANTDAQALTLSRAERVIQMGLDVTEGLGAGSQPDIGRAAANEVIDEIRDHLSGAHMVFVTAGMGGGTGTGAAPVIAQAAKEAGILTVGVVTKPFHFEGSRRMRVAEQGIIDLQKSVDTLLIIPNQNLFRVANEKTTFADAFAMADQVLYSGVACITDLMVKEGLINLDFADVRAVMREMGKAMMGTGEASGEKRALRSAEAAISNPLIDDVTMKGARGLLVSITGGKDLTLYEVDEAATRIREEVDSDANIIVGATFDESLEGIIRVSVVATGIDVAMQHAAAPSEVRAAEVAQKQRVQARPALRHEGVDRSTPVHAAAGMDLPYGAPAEDLMKQNVAAQHLPPAAMIEDVSIRPLAPKPSLFAEPQADKHAPLHDLSAKAFTPPNVERPGQRQARSLRIEDFPKPVQDEMRARREPEAAEQTPDKPRLSLLQRLASVGLGRREEAAEHAPPQSRAATRPPAQRAEAAPQPRPQMPPLPAPPRAMEPRMPDAVSEYARRVPARPAPQGLDSHGRPAPAPSGGYDDDQLEIPAFLRRQAQQ
jgi:cell division protein FtsZ